MLCEPQRVATLTNLQHAKIKAIEGIEFYTSQLEGAVHGKADKDRAALVLSYKQGIDLASQLYSLSSVLEVYYSQNWSDI